MVPRSIKLALRRIWPLIVFLSALAMLFSAAQDTYAAGLSGAEIVSLTNAQRSANGLPALSANSKLNQAAQNKAADMAARGYFDHYTPDGKSPFTFITSAGYKYTVAAENLARGCSTSTCVVNGWMGSAGHKTNILNASVTETGVGVAGGIVVAFYAKPAAAAAVPAPAPAPAPKPAPAATAKPAAAPQISQPAEVKPVEVREENKPEPAPVVVEKQVTDISDKVMVKSLSKELPWQVAGAITKLSLIVLLSAGGYMIMRFRLF